MTRPLALLLVLAGCAASEPPADAPPAPRAARPVPAHADSLLARVDRAAFADAFAALGRAGFVADVRVEMQAGESGLGHATYVVEQAPGGVPRARRTGASGTLAGSASDADAGRLAPRDPLATVLPDAAPYADPATRDRYDTVLLPDGTVRARLREGTRGAAMPVEEVRARVDPATGRVLGVRARRASEALVFDETTEAHVALGAAPGGERVPVAFATTARVRSALSEARTVRVAWRVRAVGGAAVAPLPGADLPAPGRFVPDRPATPDTVGAARP